MTIPLTIVLLLGVIFGGFVVAAVVEHWTHNRRK